MTVSNPFRKPLSSRYFTVLVAGFIGFSLGVVADFGGTVAAHLVRERGSPPDKNPAVMPWIPLQEFMELPCPKTGTVRVLIEVDWNIYHPEADFIPLRLTGVDPCLNGFCSLGIEVPKTHTDATQLEELIRWGNLHGGMTLRLYSELRDGQKKYQLERFVRFD